MEVSSRKRKTCNKAQNSNNRSDKNAHLQLSVQLEALFLAPLQREGNAVRQRIAAVPAG